MMGQRLRILFADNLHINKRNFPSLYSFIEETRAETYFCTDRSSMIVAYGNYLGRRENLTKAKVLRKLTKRELRQFTVDGIRLFDVCSAEFLSYALTLPNWQNEPLPQSKDALFEKAFIQNLDELLANMAVTWDWIEYWIVKLDNLPLLSHACIFSGSLIYQRTLIELLKPTSTRAMIMESSFTGNDYYCEEKYGPIANNSDIKFRAVCQSYQLPDDASQYDREKNKAINKILMSKNKNVVQPIDYKPLDMPDTDKTILIIGQVLNDFSLIESGEQGIASLPFYTKFIEKLASRGIGVIFKAHPWEEKKTNVEGKVTLEAIRAFVEKLPKTVNKNIVLTDHYPIEQLFETVDYVAGLNSQGMIEAAFHGHKPIQFGDAFFGNYGFTHDRVLDDVDGVANEIASGDLASLLTVREFQLFEEFLTKYLQHHLISVHKSGVLTLRERFSVPSTVSLVSRNMQVSDVANSEQETQVQIAALSPSQRKRRKLARDPYAFFRDSRHPALRPIRYFFRGIR